MNLHAMRPHLNPVLRRELIERMRGRSGVVLLTIYLVVLSGILAISYHAHSGDSGLTATRVAGVGRSLFEMLLLFMLLMVLFLVPGLTAGAIAGERERQTLVPLQVTLMGPMAILVGKVGAALAFLLLLMVATVPLLSVAFLIGGVTVGEIVRGVLLVMLVGVAVGCVSAAVSTFVRRVQFATVTAYGLVLLVTVGSMLAYLTAGVLVDRRNSTRDVSWMLTPNPVVLVATGMADEDARQAGDAPTLPLSTVSSWTRQDRNVDCWFDDLVGQEQCFDRLGRPVAARPATATSAWRSSVIYAGAGVAGIGAGALRLRTPGKRER